MYASNTNLYTLANTRGQFSEISINGLNTCKTIAVS